ncbi:anti-sigma-I factor RsgI2 [Onychostoma macrolepis]|nr:anti-sigma-I factor RsgI2 [Onychostoma macrolepis]
MSSDVKREAVFQATKIRTHLKQDGSWINRSQNVEDTQSDVKARKPVKLVKPKNVSSPESSSASSSIMPCAESAATSSSLDSSTPTQSSYVMSALRKFEPLNPTENTPVKSGSNLAKSAHPVLEDSRRAHVEKAVETSIVKATEQPLKTPADASVMDIMEKPIDKAVEEPLKTHTDAPKLDVVEKPAVKPVEVPLKTHANIPKTDVVEKPIEEPLKTYADTPKTDVVDNIVKPIEEPLKTYADTPKTDVVDNIVKPVEEPLKTPTDVPVKNIVEKPAEESLKTLTETPVEGTRKTPDGASTDQTQSSRVLQDKTVKTLHENPAKPPGTLPTENKEDATVEQVSISHAPVVQAPLQPRRAENQPTSEHGELSLVSALEPPTTESSNTEPTDKPRVAALEENHRLNSQAELNVKGKTMCSFCKLPIDGNVKISINIPAICCHPDCFKCNGCSSPLGDLSSSMYHYAGKILCEKCFDQIFQL